MLSFTNFIKKQHRDPVPAKPAADVARILDDAKVPNVLWGWLAVGLVGKDLRFPHVDFVVPDSKLQAATEALVDSGFSKCTNPACEELKEDRLTPEFVRKDPMTPEEYGILCQEDRWHPIADAHFHIEAWRYEYYDVLSLFTQSSTLWSGWWPELILSDAHGSGPWEDLYPVKFLKPSLFAEAVFFLWCRDWGHVNQLDHSWKSMVLFGLMGEERVNPQRDLIQAGLKPEILPAWKSLNYNRPPVENIYRQLKNLRQKLLDENRMPLPLPPIDLSMRDI